jgi:heme oxygenase
MLESDLVALGVDSASVAELPQCRSLFAPANAAEFMGALYVVEGSTLGGIQLARALEPLMEPYSGAGRSFFLGYGDRHGPIWRSFLIKLEGCASSNADEEALIGGAMRTFLDFETWMAGWRADPTAETSPPPISGRSEMVADQ